jgi:carbon monoxide dehydrogenase subunit G
VQLEHSFTVPVGIDDAWRVLLDIELIAPCMPGAAIDSVDGDNFTGTVKVKLGPIGLTYKGKASYIEQDETAHRAVIDARGSDSRGSGTANARVTATLTESGDSTRVDVLTDLDITGKPAQFGRGVMVDVGNKLIGQFAECLAGKLTDGAKPDAPATPISESPTTPTETAVPDETPTTPGPRPRPRPRKAAADSAPAADDADKAPPAKAPTKSSAAKSGPAKSAPAKASPAKPAPAKAPAAESSAATSIAAAATASTAAASASVPESDASASTEPTTADPVAEEKVAAVTSLPTRTATAPRRAADDVEPINLIESAGPALAKRLAPIVALVVLLILIARRRRH